MPNSLARRIQQFYDSSSDLWEQTWGEHMHHGYYGPDGSERRDRRQAQVDLIDELLTWAGVQQANQILDVGCGIGGSSLYLADRLQAQIEGITLSPVQAARATERARSAGIEIKGVGESAQPPTVRFQVADALDLPFASGKFDLVWSLESGEHMPDKLRFLQECYRVLAPGGRLLLATWCHRSTAEAPLDWTEIQHLRAIYQVYHLPYVIALSQYAAIARQARFRNVLTADWSLAVAPFWDQVITSALNPEAIFGILKSGWPTIQGALALGLMQQGYRRGLVRYGILTATKCAEPDPII